MRQQLWGMILIALFGQLGLVHAAPPANKPVVTNKTRFRIPFRFDAAALSKMNARELHLYVSLDRGKTWEFAQSITPDTGRFEYQAPADGEYWFSVKTLDGNNQLQPAGKTFEAGLMVLVDTAEPKLELTLQQLSPGKVQLGWQVTDANLDVSSLKLEYIQPGSPNWQQVSVVPRNAGQTSWSVPQGGVVAVRGTVTDLAGNNGLAQSQIQVQAGNGAGAAQPDFRQPIANTSGPNMAELPPAPAAAPEVAKTEPGSSLNPLPAVTPELPRKPAIEIAAPEITPQIGLGGGESTSALASVTPKIGNRFISDSPQKRPEITRERYSAESAPFTPWPGNSPSINSATADHFGPMGGLGNGLRDAGPQSRIVNQKRFQIGYQVDDVGPSGISSVEMYVTQDHGQKWWKYGEDADLKSPFEAEVKRDGTYGFTIRVRSGAGIAADPPAPGEPPAVTVTVDTTPPQIELLPVQQGQGAAANRLLIRWKLTEEHPSERSVSLFYASQRDGSWEQICDWQPDSGSYIWTMGRGLPGQIYLRIVARDTAGNFGKVESSQPLNIDLSRPTARIVDVEPIGTITPQQ